MIRAVQPARLYTTEFFILEKCGPNPWAHIPGFAVDRIWEDYLHVVDLALAPDACASASRVQVYLVHGTLLGILHRPEATSLVIPWSPNPFNLNHERPPLNLNPDRHWLGSNQEARLAAAYVEFSTACKEEKISYPATDKQFEDKVWGLVGQGLNN